jgi:hypothetical protein
VFDDERSHRMTNKQPHNSPEMDARLNQTKIRQSTWLGHVVLADDSPSPAAETTMQSFSIAAFRHQFNHIYTTVFVNIKGLFFSYQQ